MFFKLKCPKDNCSKTYDHEGHLKQHLMKYHKESYISALIGVGLAQTERKNKAGR